MITKVVIANTKPWCPYCEHGYQIPRSVTLDATPECDAHIMFEYQCNHCGKTMIFTEEDITPTTEKTIGIETFQRIARERGQQ